MIGYLGIRSAENCAACGAPGAPASCQPAVATTSRMATNRHVCEPHRVVVDLGVPEAERRRRWVA